MKKLEIKRTVTVDPVEHAIKISQIKTGKYMAQFIRFKEKDGEIVAQELNLDCRLRNISSEGGYEHFARLACCAFYHHSLTKTEKVLSKLEEKDLKKGLTSAENKTYELMVETMLAYGKILETFEPEYIALAKVDTFVNAAVAGYTNDFTIPYKNGANISKLVNALYLDTTTDKELKDLIAEFTLAITGAKDSIYNGYHLACNAKLVASVRHAFYKGRKLDVSSGKVKQTFDKEGSAVAKEIVLAIIEDLQKKAQAVATDNDIPAASIETK